MGTPSAADPEAEARSALDRGDTKAALGVLMAAYGSAVYRFCRQMVVDEAMADDVHQMTFVQAYEGLDRFKGRSSLSTWLYSIARHRCLDALKSARRQRARFESVAELPEVPGGPSEAEGRLAERSRRRALELCLEELPPAIRTALLLRFQQELSYPEMAAVCGERAPTLQARVVRALPGLRRCLEQQGEAP